MTTVDFHVHVAKFDMWTPWVHEYMKRMNPAVYEDFDRIMTPDGILKLLDREDIDFAVVLAEIAPLTTGIVKNEFIADFCKKSERLIPFASINPITDPSPRETLAKLVNDFGMKGLKLLPPYQHFYPNNTRFYALYEKAQELRIPVVFHTGSSVFKNAKLKFGNPMYLDDLAVDFPDLTIVQAHGGRAFWYDIAFFLAKRHENVYIDISGLPSKNLLKYFPELEKIVNKVIFGSDWPGVPSVRSNVEAIQKLSLRAETKRKILGENALKLLKL
ncbi:MAG: amidohydrolase family protein [Candidatus Bathyarchaeota archaeon]